MIACRCCRYNNTRMMVDYFKSRLLKEARHAMSISTVNFLRFIVPSILTLVYWSIWVWLITGRNTQLPDLSKAQYSPVIIFIALVYYILPLRKKLNEPSHRRIIENLRLRILQIAGVEGKKDEEKYSWKRIKPIFFKMIDDDKSLTIKSATAFFNGLIWTSSIDSMIISLLFSIISIILVIYDWQIGLFSAFVFLMIAAGSWIAHIITEKKQIEIGNDQIEHMQQIYSQNIKDRIREL